VTRLAHAAAFWGVLVPAAAAVAEEGVPVPRGWVGTTAQWVQGFGIAFALLNLALLCLAWGSLGRDPQFRNDVMAAFRKCAATVKRTYQSHFFIRRSSPSAHARATA